MKLFEEFKWSVFRSDLFVAIKKKSHFDAKVDSNGFGGLQKGSFLRVWSYSVGGRCQMWVRKRRNTHMLHPKSRSTHHAMKKKRKRGEKKTRSANQATAGRL